MKYIISRVPVAQRAAKQSTVTIGTEPNACNHAYKSFHGHHCLRHGSWTCALFEDNDQNDMTLSNMAAS